MKNSIWIVAFNDWDGGHDPGVPWAAMFFTKKDADDFANSLFEECEPSVIEKDLSDWSRLKEK